MRLGQISTAGGHVAAIFPTETTARPIPGHTMRDLIERSEAEQMPLSALANQLASRHSDLAKPIIPLHPWEVWGCGCTYETSASFRDGEQGTRDGMYAQVYRSPRPELFFKGTSRVCVGHDCPVGIRSDSNFTAPEPEVALVLNKKGQVLAYTMANDVSAWDIERDNPLYLPQSKTFNACCSLGPYLITPDEIPDPYNLQMTCTVMRGDVTRFEGSTSTARLNRKFEVMVEYLLRSNNVPTGSVLLTGTGIIVTESAALAPGDVIHIHVPELGTLSNQASAA
ncbi:MAG: fumarylacetoacetate hydrolase family protein [Acidobacteriota bacterium]|nr:fumarylacetoacetate hydrolase family protein [Acidobacteriota bacterium]